MATQTLDTKGMNCPLPILKTKKAIKGLNAGDRKSTRLNSSHITISYAVFCLKKKMLHKINHNKTQKT